MSRPRALPVVSDQSITIGALVEELVKHEPDPSTIVVVCSSRSRFLEQLIWEALQSYQQEEHREDNDTRENDSSSISGKDELGAMFSRPQVSPLLAPTLRLLTTSRKIKVVFCPSIPVFRAYVSTLPLSISESRDDGLRIVVVDMLAMHYGTSEFTIQGLSRSFAILGSVSYQLRSRMDIFECSDFHDPLDPTRGNRLWSVEVPLLNGSVKIGQAGQGWAARTTSIKTFAARWLRFERAHRE